MGSSLVPPLRSDSYRVMSSLPLGFLAPWQPKHDSLRIGATSLMKLTGRPAGGVWAEGDDGASSKAGRGIPRAGHRTQGQQRGRKRRGTPKGGREEAGAP